MRRSTLSFDELNSLFREEYEEWFDEMDIDEDAKEDRVLTAMALEDAFLQVFSFIQMRLDNGEPFLADSISLFEAAFMAVALTRLGLTEDDVREDARRFADAVALTTYNHKDTPYYTSADRAVNMAKTESNSINCHGDLVDAVMRGYTKKTWHSLLDGRERLWHHDADGQTVPIDEPFEIIGEYLMYPLDTSLGASDDNIANCRCFATFA